MKLRSNGIAPAPEEAVLSPRLASSRVASKIASDAAKHPISQMVFTASTVVIASGIFFYLQSIAPMSDLKLIPLEGGNGGLGKRNL